MGISIESMAGGGPVLGLIILPYEWILLAGVVVTLLGTLAQWQFPRWRMSAEEAVKDGRLTELAARRRIGVHRWMGPSLIISGGGLMLWSLSTLM